MTVFLLEGYDFNIHKSASYFVLLLEVATITATKRERESWSLGLEAKAIKSKPIKSSDYKTIFKTIFF